jgi:hypothetical protein
MVTTDADRMFSYGTVTFKLLDVQFSKSTFLQRINITLFPYLSISGVDTVIKVYSTHPTIFLFYLFTSRKE